MSTALELFLDALQWAWDHNVNLIRWCWSHKRAAAELALAVALLILGWRYNSEKAAWQKQVSDANGLAAGIGLQLKITQNQLQIMRRDSSGTVTSKTVYLAPEGYVIIDQKQKDALEKKISDLTAQLNAAIASGDSKAISKINSQISQVDGGIAVTVVDHGFTFKPGYGLDWSNQGVKPRLDFKYYYYRRYGLIAGGGPNGLGPGISRHLDDIIWGNPQNVEAFLQYNAIRFYGGSANVTVGVRSNF